MITRCEHSVAGIRCRRSVSGFVRAEGDCLATGEDQRFSWAIPLLTKIVVVVTVFVALTQLNRRKIAHFPGNEKEKERLAGFFFYKQSVSVRKPNVYAI